MAHILLATLLAVSYPFTLFTALRNKPLWQAGLVLDALLLFFLGNIQFYIVLACTVLASLPLVTRYTTGSVHLRQGINISIAILAVLLRFHLLPGFEKIVLFQAYSLSDHSAAFDIAYPADKAVGVVLLLGFGVAFSVSSRPAMKFIFITSMLVVGAVLAFALPVGI